MRESDARAVAFRDGALAAFAFLDEYGYELVQNRTLIAIGRDAVDGVDLRWKSPRVPIELGYDPRGETTVELGRGRWMRLVGLDEVMAVRPIVDPPPHPALTCDVTVIRRIFERYARVMRETDGLLSGDRSLYVEPSRQARANRHAWFGYEAGRGDRPGRRLP